MNKERKTFSRFAGVNQRHDPRVPEQDAGNLTGEIKCMAPMFHNRMRGI